MKDNLKKSLKKITEKTKKAYNKWNKNLNGNADKIDNTKKDAITVIISMLILFVASEMFLKTYEFWKYKTFVPTVVVGIIFGILVPTVIIYICRKNNKISFTKKNKMIFVIMLISVILLKSGVLLYRQVKINNIVKITQSMEQKIPEAKSVNELLDILKLTKKERKILEKEKFSDEEAVNFVVKTINAKIGKYYSYDDWKALYVNRGFIIVKSWNYGKKIGFKEDNYSVNSINKEIVVPSGNDENYYKKQFNALKKNVDEFTIAAVISLLYEVVAAGVIIILIKEKE